MKADCRLQAGPFRHVVLHADDFGMNAAVTRGILRGFTHGLLTSTSVLANAPDCSSALAAWNGLVDSARSGSLPSAGVRRGLGDGGLPFDLGIHLNLTQGRPLTRNYPSDLLDREGRFPGIFKLFRRLAGSERRYRDGIAAELEAQVRVLVDHGLPPSHLNGHQYIELLPGVSAVIPRLLIKFSIPVVRVARERRLFRTTLLRRFQVADWFLGQVKRSFATQFLIDMRRYSVPHPDEFFGTAHAGRIDLGLIQQFLAGAVGTHLTEIGLHPGLNPEPGPASAAPDGWNDPLARLRPGELDLLTSPELADLFANSSVRLGRLGNLACRAAA